LWKFSVDTEHCRRSIKPDWMRNCKLGYHPTMLNRIGQYYTQYYPAKVNSRYTCTEIVQAYVNQSAVTENLKCRLHVHYYTNAKW